MPENTPPLYDCPKGYLAYSLGTGDQEVCVSSEKRLCLGLEAFLECRGCEHHLMNSSETPED